MSRYQRSGGVSFPTASSPGGNVVNSNLEVGFQLLRDAASVGGKFWAVVKRRLGWKWFLALFPIDADEVACRPLATRNIYERPVLPSANWPVRCKPGTTSSTATSGVGDSKSVHVEFRTSKAGSDTMSDPWNTAASTR